MTWVHDRFAVGRPWVIAHRGDSAHAPENTLEAARRAYDSGADAWELDVLLTRDGVPLVLHDESLSRTTDVHDRFAGDPRLDRGALVHEFDLSEVRTLDAGSWFVKDRGAYRSASYFQALAELSEADIQLYASGKVRAPTLEEALELTAQLDWAVNVELKAFPSQPEGLLEKVLAVIDATGTGERAWVSSFDHDLIGRLAQARPSIATGLLSDTPLHHPERYARELVRAWAYHPSTEVVGARSNAYIRQPGPHHLRHEELGRLRSAGVPVFVYTVNAPQPGGLADHLRDAGATGAFTDDPGPLVARWSARG